MLTVFGHDAVRKARHAGQGILRRLQDRGCTYREPLIECLGTGASVRGIVRRLSDTHLVARIPLTVLAELTKTGQHPSQDQKAFARWLDRPDNRVFRTRPGKMSR